MDNPIESLVSSFLSMGGRPSGDPQAMLEDAARLRQQAYRLEGDRSLVEAQHRIPYYEGPQADAHEHTVQAHTTQLRSLASRLHNAADAGTQMARRLSDSQVAWDRQFTRTITGIPAVVVKQAQRAVGWL